MNLNYASWVDQLDPDLGGRGLVRWIFYTKIDNSAIVTNLDTCGRFIHAKTRLRKARADENKSKSYGQDDAAG
jgi:hypothetical protein